MSIHQEQTEKLYNLLPSIYRIRDAEQGEPLKALLAVIAEQMAVLEEDLAQLYDDQFIETCAEWVVPYIGDLIGVRGLKGKENQQLTSRALVANTIAYRRRKGTITVLEQLAHDVTGWPAHAVEFFQRLATTQYMNHIRPDNRNPNLRKWEPLERIDTAFDSFAHTAEVRHIASGRGRYNIPNIGLFLWRLESYRLKDSPACQADPNDANRYLFSPLGNNAQLFTFPETEEELAGLSRPINLPMPISRRVLSENLEAYYGKDKSIFIAGIEDYNQITICNLSDDKTGSKWAHEPPMGKVAIDPALGRIAFGDAQTRPPLVTFHYGFSSDMGGGEYDRLKTFSEIKKITPFPGKPSTIQQAINDALSNTDNEALEIDDNEEYKEQIAMNFTGKKHFELRSTNQHRPTLELNSSTPGEIVVNGVEGAELTLNGLLLAGGSLRVKGQLDHLRLVHCTLVPGLSLNIDGSPTNPTAPSLIVESPNTMVEIDHCIVGGLRIVEGAKVHISDSIIDATDETHIAYSAKDDVSAGGPLQIINSTVIGKVNTTVMELASNTIFLASLSKTDTWNAPVQVERKQEGCVRFCYIPPGSSTPRRYRCQPENDADILRVRPQFTSLRYGAPGYCQLCQRCAIEIRQGAYDESEMGAFHDLFQPQRETALRSRLDEYLRFGLEAGIIYTS